MSQHINPTPNQTDITALNSNIANLISARIVPNGPFPVNTEIAFTAREQAAKLLVVTLGRYGANSVVIIDMTYNFGSEQNMLNYSSRTVHITVAADKTKLTINSISDNISLNCMIVAIG